MNEIGFRETKKYGKRHVKHVKKVHFFHAFSD